MKKLILGFMLISAHFAAATPCNSPKEWGWNQKVELRTNESIEITGLPLREFTNDFISCSLHGAELYSSVDSNLASYVAEARVSHTEDNLDYSYEIFLKNNIGFVAIICQSNNGLVSPMELLSVFDGKLSLCIRE